MTANHLAGKRRAAVFVSAALIYRDNDLLKTEYKSALKHDLTLPELVEIILQALLFDGYPCTLEGLIALQSIPGVQLPYDEFYEPYTAENVARWATRGNSLCQSIYRKNYEPLIANVGSMSRSLQDWMLYEGYGRILARPSLSIDIREMGIIAILTVKNFPRQLHSHLKGALHVGVSLSELNEAIDLCSPFTSNDNILDAHRILNKIGVRGDS